MSIWFPDLPLDLRTRMGDGRVEDCFAIIREIKNAWRLTHISPTALDAGLHAGISLSDARAIAPHLLTEPANPEREDALLRALWRWSDQLSPWAALDAPDGLYLDITGCAQLFGGEKAMAEHAQNALCDLHMCARIAVCDTRRGAWGLARFSGLQQVIAPIGGTREALQLLPLAALGVKRQTERDLRRVGLKTIGDLYPFKTSELARRFGLELTERLSHALGHSPDPVSPQAADKTYSARMTLPEPIGFKDDIQEVVTRLARSICDKLREAQVGARHFDLIVRCVDRGDKVISVGFARPCFEGGAIWQQLARPLDELHLEFGADWFRLKAANIEPVKARQMIIGDEDARREDDLARAISTLGNRLGFDRILRLTPQQSHTPEREFARKQAISASENGWANSEIFKTTIRPERIFIRPEKLFTLEAGRPPKRFEWRKDVYATASATGPERVMPEWWVKGDRRTRDYWTAQTDTGARLWLLTYPASDPPEWYVAGRFA